MIHPTQSHHLNISILIEHIRLLPETPLLTVALERKKGIGVGDGRAWYISQKEHWLGWLGESNKLVPYERRS